MNQLFPALEDLCFLLVLLSFDGMTFEFDERFIQDINIMFMNNNPADGWRTITSMPFEA